MFLPRNMKLGATSIGKEKFCCFWASCSSHTVLFFFSPALGHGQKLVPALICCAALRWQIDWLLTNTSTQCQRRHGQRRSAACRFRGRAVICWRFVGWQPCFIPHFHCAIKGSSVVLDAAVYLLVFVIITVSQAGKPERETEGVRARAGVGAVQPRLGQESPRSTGITSCAHLSSYRWIPNGSWALSNPEGKDAGQLPNKISDGAKSLSAACCEAKICTTENTCENCWFALIQKDIKGI